MKHNVHYYIDMAYENKEAIEKAETCGCYFCNKLFNKEQVEYQKEQSGKETAWCPFCHIDSVIDNVSVEVGGEELTVGLLEDIHKEAFAGI